MMSRTGDYGFYRGDGFQAVRIPYGGERVGMYVFLPDPDSGLEQFHQQLNQKNWQQWLEHFRVKNAHLVLPRFGFEYEVQLIDALKDLGMGIAFDPHGADFTGICPQLPDNLYIGEVKHKTFVEVNEQGTEAAAVTSVDIKCAGLIEAQQMVVVRPFFFAIQDDLTGTILFMGSVWEPRV